MTEFLQGKQVVERDFETTIEESEKRIKLLLRPVEIKACLEYFRKEAESQLLPLPVQEPLIKVKRNLHPLFLGEALEYIREFHKKHSANDLYGLPKACQDTIDLVLTCPNAERIIKKNFDSGLKARFQYVHEARVLGFDVDPYTDINVAELPFSLEDLQYLGHHFEVFFAVSLFGLTANETKRVARLDAYLDTRNACIMYQEQTRGMTQVLNLVEINTQNEKALVDLLHGHIPTTVETKKADAFYTNLTEEGLGEEDPEEEETTTRWVLRSLIT